MSGKKTGDSSGDPPPAPNFDEVVRGLKEEGIHSIRKRRFSLIGEDWVPDYYLGPSRALDDPTALEEPDFWVPIGYDGYGWTVFLCVPPWLENDPRAANWYAIWRDDFDWLTSGEVSEDSEYFIHRTLSEMAAFDELVPINPDGSSKEDAEADLQRARAAAKAGMTALKQAMIEAYQIDGTFPPRTEGSLAEGEVLKLSDQIARVMERAYRAGKLHERASLYYRGVPEVARGAKVLWDAQRGKRRRKLKPWEAKAVEILSTKPKIKSRELAERLHAEGILFTGDSWDTVDFEEGFGGPEGSLQWNAFERRISGLRKYLREFPDA